MKIRVAEFQGCKQDKSFAYSIGNGKYIFSPIHIKVFSSVTEPTFNFMRTMADICGASKEQLTQIKKDYIRFLKAREEYTLSVFVDTTDEEDMFDELLEDTNDILFLDEDHERFVERTRAKSWSARDQVEYDYDGGIE